MIEVHQVTLIEGDGIGPEIIRATLTVLEASGVRFEWLKGEAGAQVFRRGVASGVTPETIQAIKQSKVVLKGPLETPVGFGEQSANVTLRKLFETFANLRPVRELPGVLTPFSGRGINLLVIRENIEDLYAGIEYMQSFDVAQGIKLITRPGSERIIRFAFEHALAAGLKTLHCATKANIMKLTEGLFKKVFEEIALEYPQIKAQHIIVDNLAHQLVRRPESFEAIVTTNLNGDIISDLTSGLIGGLGFAPSANIGSDLAIFEAVHGSAPDIAGKGLANPTALILSACLMLNYLKEYEAAAKLENALLLTLQQAQNLTADMAVKGQKAASTQEFAEAVARNFKDAPNALKHKPLTLNKAPENRLAGKPQTHSRRDVGVDIFIESGSVAALIGQELEHFTQDLDFKLEAISNRGSMVYPRSSEYSQCVDVYRCRFILRAEKTFDHKNFLQLLDRIAASYRWMHVEKLLEMDGKAAYSAI